VSPLIKKRCAAYKKEASRVNKKVARLGKKDAKLGKEEGKKTRKDKKYTAFLINRAANLVKKSKRLLTAKSAASKSAASKLAPRKVNLRFKVPKKVRKVHLKQRAQLEALKDKEPKKYTKIIAIKQKRHEEKMKRYQKPAGKRISKLTLKPGCYRTWKGKKEVIKRRIYIEKPIGGANNGGTRRVLHTKRPAYYAAQLNPKRKLRKSKNCTKKIRPSITPGTVCILLAGVHKGKRVIFLKKMDKTGLALVTGPFKINACPLRRVNQIFLIATSTKIDVSNVKIPRHINDDYFRRSKQVRSKKEEGDIFGMKTEKYVVSELRKKDQRGMDRQLIKAIQTRKDKKAVFGLMKRYFGLRNAMYPHRLHF